MNGDRGRVTSAFYSRDVPLVFHFLTQTSLAWRICQISFFFVSHSTTQAAEAEQQAQALARKAEYKRALNAQLAADRAAIANAASAAAMSRAERSMNAGLVEKARAHWLAQQQRQQQQRQ
jgi:hypothetical protein